VSLSQYNAVDGKEQSRWTMRPAPSGFTHRHQFLEHLAAVGNDTSAQILDELASSLGQRGGQQLPALLALLGPRDEVVVIVHCGLVGQERPLRRVDPDLKTQSTIRLIDEVQGLANPGLPEPVPDPLLGRFIISLAGIADLQQRDEIDMVERVTGISG